MSPTPTPPALADSVNLDEGWALLESATPGPWEVTYETRVIQEVCTIHCVEPMPDGEGGAQGWCHIVPPRVIDGKWIWSSQKQQTANAALIVYAVNNLPALLSAVAALERERDEAVKAERERCAVLRVWLLDLSANESDPNEPVADNGATVWDHIRGDARRFAESLT